VTVVTTPTTEVPLSRQTWFIRVLQAAVIVSFIGMWEGLGQVGVLDKFFYSRPSLIVPRIAGWFAEGFIQTSIYRDIEVTLTETVLGFVIGTFLGVTRAQVLLLLAIAVVALAALALIGRPLLYLSVDEPAAAAAGVPVRMLSIGFLVVLGLAIASTALITGALLVFALLVMPAAAANQLVARPGLAMLVSVGLGLVIVWSGLTISYFTDLPIGFLVTGVGFVIYAVARLARQLSGA